MKTFNQEKKDLLVAEIIRHREADQLMQGTYGQEKHGDWKGCAVGCAIHSLNLTLGKTYSTNDHSVYETELGIPELLAILEDRIFEGLSVEDSKTWPEKFMQAVPVEADLSLVWPKFAVWLLVDEKDGVLQYADSHRSIAAITRVAELYKKVIDGETVDRQTWRDADADAYASAYASASASASASSAYASAYAAASAAAYAAASVSADAAYAAYAAAAASAAAYAAASAAADAAARQIHYKKCASKLLEILSETT